MTSDILVTALAEGDCEAVADPLWGQPVNTVSSLAFVLVGVWLIVRSLRRGARIAWPQAALGVAAVLAGIGSVAFHGPMPAVAPLLHDLGLAAIPLTVATTATASARARGPANLLLHTVPVLGVAGVVLLLRPGAGNAVAAVAVLWALRTEFTAWTQGVRSWTRRSRRSAIVAVGAFALAVPLHVFGGTGGALCNATSPWQAHAGWHVLAAIAVAALAIVVHERPRARHRRPALRAPV